jgi:hypothetical protein
MGEAQGVGVGARLGSGRRARSPRKPGGSVPKVTVSSAFSAIVRMVVVSARLKGSTGPSLLFIVLKLSPSRIRQP